MVDIEKHMNNDLISRSALKKAIEQGEGFSWDSHGKDDLCVRKKYIDNAPTVRERPQGKWVKITKDGVMPIEYICNFCGRIIKSYHEEYIITEYFPFCHCGADMRGGAE